MPQTFGVTFRLLRCVQHLLRNVLELFNAVKLTVFPACQQNSHLIRVYPLPSFVTQSDRLFYSSAAHQ